MSLDSYYEHTRGDVVDLIRRTVPIRGKVLDIGCASGAIGEQLLSMGFEEVWGVEIDDKAAKRAERRLTRVVRAPFPCDEADEGSPFDVVLMADSLEHLADPWGALSAIQRLLAPGGCVVLSLPNVSHYSVVFDQFRGHWDYAEEGLLDCTHLRFFTPGSAVALLGDSGFVVDCMESTCHVPGRRWSLLTVIVRRFLPHLLVSQFRVVARRRSGRGVGKGVS